MVYICSILKENMILRLICDFIYRHCWNTVILAIWQTSVGVLSGKCVLHRVLYGPLLAWCTVTCARATAMASQMYDRDLREAITYNSKLPAADSEAASIDMGWCHQVAALDDGQLAVAADHGLYRITHQGMIFILIAIWFMLFIVAI